MIVSFSNNTLNDLQKEKLISILYVISTSLSPIIFSVLEYLNDSKLSGSFFATEIILMITVIVLLKKIKQYLTDKRYEVSLVSFFLFISINYQVLLYVLLDWNFCSNSILKNLRRFDHDIIPICMVCLLFIQILLYFGSILLPRRYQSLDQNLSGKIIRLILEISNVAGFCCLVWVLGKVDKNNFAVVAAIEVAIISINPNQILSLIFGPDYLDKQITPIVRHNFLVIKFWLIIGYVSWVFSTYSQFSVKEFVKPEWKWLYHAMGFDFKNKFTDRFYSTVIPFFVLLVFFQIVYGIMQNKEEKFKKWIIQNDTEQSTQKIQNHLDPNEKQ